jgi:hypothetical protein
MKRILIAAAFVLIAHLGYAVPGNNSNSSPSISGTVVDATTKKPLADVTVVAMIGTTKTEVVTTNAQGQFKISSLVQGTYTLKISKEDYKAQDKKEVVVKPDNTAKVSVELISEGTESNNSRSWWDKYELFE